MTCEVAVMNKHGVALAADSAVTLGEGPKIYNTAEKLFQISQSAPVGLMTFGAAEIMSTPWELVIKMYSRQFGEKKFDRLEQYAEDFLRFVEASNELFPESLQREWFRSLMESVWNQRLLEPMKAQPQISRRPSATNYNNTLSGLLEADLLEWNFPIIEHLGSAYGERVIAEYGDVLDELEVELFEAAVSPENKTKLREMARNMHCLTWFHPADETGIVFAGMGEREPFPALHEYHVGPIAAGKLRFSKVDEVKVSRERSACVAPFGQAEMIHMFYRGVHPDLEKKIFKIISEETVMNTSARSGKKPQKSKLDELVTRVRDRFEEEISEEYQRPLIAAVDALPRQDLATMAEALVSLTAFRLRMSADQQETVGGPIDVAVLSRGEGFVWVKRKDPLGVARVGGAISVL